MIPLLDIRPYKAADAIEILSGNAKQPGLELDALTVKWAQEKETKGPAITGTVEGRIIGCAGLEIPWPRFAEGWCIFIDDIDKYALPMARKARPILKGWIKEFDLIRVQAPMRADFEAGLRFVDWLGLKLEARLKKYHPDACDALMYSIVGE